MKTSIKTLIIATIIAIAFIFTVNTASAGNLKRCDPELAGVINDVLDYKDKKSHAVHKGNEARAGKKNPRRYERRLPHTKTKLEVMIKTSDGRYIIGALVDVVVSGTNAVKSVIRIGLWEGVQGDYGWMLNPLNSFANSFVGSMEKHYDYEFDDWNFKNRYQAEYTEIRDHLVKKALEKITAELAK